MKKSIIIFLTIVLSISSAIAQIYTPNGSVLQIDMGNGVLETHKIVLN